MEDNRDQSTFFDGRWLFEELATLAANDGDAYRARSTKGDAQAARQAVDDAMNATRTKPESITIFGRRWFDRTYGNTYFSAEIVIDGEHVHRIEFEYGYGDQYLAAAFDWLDENGYTSRERHTSGAAENPTRYCREHGIALVYDVADVSRKRDL